MARVRSDGQILEDMGIDAAKWTDEFLSRHLLVDRSGLAPDHSEAWGSMVSWFANAIEAGRTAGRRELCPHDWLTLGEETHGETLALCRDCGRSSTFTAGGPTAVPDDDR